MSQPHERLEFEQTVEGLFRGALGADDDLELTEALRRAGLDLTKKLAPAYRPEDVYRWLRLAARHKFPELDEETACFRTGVLSVERGLKSTLIGRAVLGVVKVIGIRRAMLRIGPSFRHGNNYIEAKVTELGPRKMEIELGPLVGPTAYFAGVLESGPRILGARSSTVTAARKQGEHVTFVLEWSE